MAPRLSCTFVQCAFHIKCWHESNAPWEEFVGRKFIEQIINHYKCISLNVFQLKYMYYLVFVVAKSVVVTVDVLPTQVVICLLAACTQLPVRGLLAFTSITQQTNNPNMDTFAKIFMCPKMTLWVPKQKNLSQKCPKNDGIAFRFKHFPLFKYWTF